jgi:hypothetical protein
MSAIHYHVITEGVAATDPLVFRTKSGADRYVGTEIAEEISEGLVTAEIVPCRKNCINTEGRCVTVFTED